MNWKTVAARIKGIARTARRDDAFTLIEVLIVVAIIAIMGGIIGPRLFDMPQKARVTATREQMRSFGIMLDRYNLDKGRYPGTEEGLSALATEGYMQKNEVPLDPWGNEYIYTSPGESNPENEYEIISLGADGKPGGEGTDADIRSWE